MPGQWVKSQQTIECDIEYPLFNLSALRSLLTNPTILTSTYSLLLLLLSMISI